MAYIFIFDLDGASEWRRRVNRYLRQNAELVQHSVWRFQNFGRMLHAAERVFAAGGKAMAFVESDRVLLRKKDVQQFLSEARGERCPK